MSDSAEQFLTALRHHSERHKKTMLGVGVVMEINEDDYTCTVSDPTDLEYYDVRLKSVVGAESEELVIVPKMNSSVLIANIGQTETEWVVVKCNVVDKIIYKIGTLQFEMDADGYKISKSGINLKEVLDGLIDQIKLITVPTPAGPSGVPVNAAAFDVIKSQLDQILK